MEARELKYEFEEENNIFRLGFDMDNAPVRVVIKYNDEKQVILNNAWIPISLPKERKAAILYAINKIHSEYAWTA